MSGRGPGPGFLVSAAFVGPGTVTAASLAGVRSGHELAWAVLFSVIATLILQEQCARLGVVTRDGLGQAIRHRFTGPARSAAAVLVTLAIGVGNAAYQGGNLTGAALGLEGLSGGGRAPWVLAIAAVAAVLLWNGSFRGLLRILMGMVLFMSALFLISAVLAAPALSDLLEGLLVPRLPGDGGDALFAIALIGTTVVPYNLFLHASAAARHWRDLPPAQALRAARRDTVLGVLVGGLITLSIMVSAVPVGAAGVQVNGVAELALQLEPVLGTGARWVFAAGLSAAGITSAITAPLAAAWAVSGVMGWEGDLRDPRIRAIWLTVLLFGAGAALLGARPLHLITLAQVANAILLPAVAIFLLVAMNDRTRLGEARNGLLANLGAGLVLVVIALLTLRQLSAFLGRFG